MKDSEAEGKKKDPLGRQSPPGADSRSEEWSEKGRRKIAPRGLADQRAPTRCEQGARGREKEALISDGRNKKRKKKGNQSTQLQQQEKSPHKRPGTLYGGWGGMGGTGCVGYEYNGGQGELGGDRGKRTKSYTAQLYQV